MPDTRARLDHLERLLSEGAGCGEPHCSLHWGHNGAHIEKRLVMEDDGAWFKYRAWGEWGDYIGMPERSV